MFEFLQDKNLIGLDGESFPFVYVKCLLYMIRKALIKLFACFNTVFKLLLCGTPTLRVINNITNGNMLVYHQHCEVSIYGF